ncbi:hypothetical protein T492DRAFT_1102045 [Pavlovales sp. CCMP2436]|nr:hypothetical protein T492DRAFT_1102045 [Pavlovales sp. CCMP2436]
MEKFSGIVKSKDSSSDNGQTPSASATVLPAASRVIEGFTPTSSLTASFALHASVHRNPTRRASVPSSERAAWLLTSKVGRGLMSKSGNLKSIPITASYDPPTSICPFASTDTEMSIRGPGVALASPNAVQTKSNVSATEPTEITTE